MGDPEYEKKIKKLKIRQSKGGQLNFAEKNILKMYDKKIAKQNRENDGSST